MALPDITKYDDDKLADLLNAIINEQERRARREQVPAQIAAMAQRFVEEGGDPAALREAVSGNAAPESEPSSE